MAKYFLMGLSVNMHVNVEADSWEEAKEKATELSGQLSKHADENFGGSVYLECFRWESGDEDDHLGQPVKVDRSSQLDESDPSPYDSGYDQEEGN